MIEWMQTHRKWLVITIWVATIAFIGAGFVGWGQFQFGKKASTVAKIKDTEVSIGDVQQIYNNLFEQENAKYNGKLDDATAEKLGLKKKALTIAIQRGVLRQFAKDMGLYVTDEEVARKILQYFKDEKTYKRYLAQTGQKAKEFEAKLKKEMLIEKLLTLMNLKPQKPLVLAFASSLYNSDNLKINIINKDDIKVTLSEKEIKEYWQKHKNNYLSQTKYKIAIVKTPLQGNPTEKDLKTYYENNKLNYKNAKGEIMSFSQAKNLVKRDYLAKINRKPAIIAYKNLKEGKENYKLLTLPLDNEEIPNTKMQTLISNGYLKPFIYKNAYISAKLLEELKPKPLSFEKAKPYVTADLMAVKIQQNLIKEAQNALKNGYKGKTTGFITKYDIDKIKPLNANEAAEFLFTVFSSQQPKGYILIPSSNPTKAVVYTVLEQKLLDVTKYKRHKNYIENIALQILNESLSDDIVKDLMAKYNIVTYVK